MLNHHLFLATSIGIGVAGYKHVGEFSILSGVASALYWSAPVHTLDFNHPRLILDICASVIMCASVAHRRLVQIVACLAWTVLAALFCITSWSLSFSNHGSSSRQRLSHFAMHICAIGALVTLG